MDWIEYLNIWERLSPDMKRVGELVGVEERFLIRAMRGTINRQTEKQVTNLSST
jgi:DNA polymerase theta